MQESSIFIRVLRYGAEKGLSGFTQEEYKVWLNSLTEVQNEDSIEYQRGHSLLNECFDRASLAPRGQIFTHFILKSEYYFRLIEYQELEEARKAARSANRNSFIAISISVVAIFAGVYMSYMQTTTPTILAENQTNIFREILVTNAEAQEKQTKQQTSEIIEILSSINDKLDGGIVPPEMTP